MHKGGIVYIRENSISVPDYLLKSINIYEGASLTGIYYPTPQKYIKKGIVKVLSHDFIFTPINFFSWAFLLRINIKISENVGTISKISFILSDLGINILSADCHKVGHRYLVWSIIGEVTAIKEQYDKGRYRWKVCKEDNAFPEYNNYKSYEKFERLEKLISDEVEKFIDGDEKNKSLKKRIIDAGKKSLFSFSKSRTKNVDSDYPVIIVKAKTLPFHFWELQRERFRRVRRKKKLKNKEDKLNKELESLEIKANTYPMQEKLEAKIKKTADELKQINIIRDPFKVTVKNNSLIFDESISKEILEVSGISNQGIPTFGFANIHTSAMRLRVSVIDKNDVENYKRIIIDYKAHGLGRTSKGYVYKIANLLKKEKINLYNIANRIWKSEKLFETGTMEFIAKLPPNYHVSKNNNNLKSYIEDKLELRDIVVDVRSINPYKIFVSIISNFFFREQFILLCREVGSEIGLLEDTFIFVKDNTNSTTEAVVNSMKNSDGVLQFYIDFAQNKKKFSHWLDAEYFAAVALNLPVVRIKEFSQNIQPIVHKDIEALELNMSDSKEIIREVLREALQDLIVKMQEKRNTLYSIE